MKRLKAHRPSPAMVVACLALFASVAGTATALPGKDSVDRDDLRSDTVYSSNLRKHSVTSGKIGLDSVTTSKVRNNNLTGDDINESTLGPVPEVSFLKRFAVRVPFGGSVELASNGSVSVFAGCVRDGTVGGNPNHDGVQVYAKTTQDGAFLAGYNGRAGDVNGDGLTDDETLDTDDTIDESNMFWASFPSTSPNEQYVGNTIDRGWVLGPDGSYIGIDGETLVMGLRTPGGDCTVIGAATFNKI